MRGNGLTAEERQSWEQDGYVILRNAVSRAERDDVVSAIWRFLEMDPDDPEDWYSTDKRAASRIDDRGIAPFYHHQALWNCRQSARIYEAFAALLGSRKLLVSVDRVNMNPPVNERWSYTGFIHWDIDVSVRPMRAHLQGLLSLTDADGERCGGFQCVPGFHREIAAWLDRQPPGYCTRFPDTSGMQVRSVALSAGDFLIWHGALPHGNTANRSLQPRLAQYITMFPADEVSAESRRLRIQSYLAGCAPRSQFDRPLPEGRTAGEEYRPAALSDLGRRLLGIEAWG